MSVEVSLVSVGYFLVLLGNMIGIGLLILSKKFKDEDGEFAGIGSLILTWLLFFLIGNGYYKWIVFT